VTSARRSPARPIAAALALLALAAAAFALAHRGDGPQPRAPTDRPGLMLVTTLPLIFAEGFTVEGGGSKALTALESRYRIIPIGITDEGSLHHARLLMMAHALAQPAEALADLDRWVRNGGRVLLLADPRLSWHSDRPLGDKLRPPPAFADTGLLAHWGLTLAGPYPDGPASVILGDKRILAVTPGSLNGGCAIGEGGFVARCRLGKGKATVIADADFLNVDEIDGPTADNLEALLAELAALER
jgi:hypothetical protein